MLLQATTSAEKIQAVDPASGGVFGTGTLESSLLQPWRNVSNSTGTRTVMVWVVCSG